MTYIKFGPAVDFGDFNKKLHSFFDELPNIGLDINYQVKPRTNFYADDENAYIEVELPGVKKEDIKISLKNNVLSVSGEKKDLQDKKGTVFTSERIFGPFNRSYQLPEGLNTEDVKAAIEDGILKITVSKKAKNQAQEKEIKIN